MSTDPVGQDTFVSHLMELRDRLLRSVLVAREQGLGKHELTQAEARLTLSPVRIRAAVRGARLALRYGQRALDRLARLEAAL